MEEKENSKMKG